MVQTARPSTKASLSAKSPVLIVKADPRLEQLKLRHGAKGLQEPAADPKELNAQLQCLDNMHSDLQRTSQKELSDQSRDIESVQKTLAEERATLRKLQKQAPKREDKLAARGLEASTHHVDEMRRRLNQILEANSKTDHKVKALKVDCEHLRSQLGEDSVAPGSAKLAQVQQSIAKAEEQLAKAVARRNGLREDVQTLSEEARQFDSTYSSMYDAMRRERANAGRQRIERYETEQAQRRAETEKRRVERRVVEQQLAKRSSLLGEGAVLDEIEASTMAMEFDFAISQCQTKRGTRTSRESPGSVRKAGGSNHGSNSSTSVDGFVRGGRSPRDSVDEAVAAFDLLTPRTREARTLMQQLMRAASVSTSHDLVAKAFRQQQARQSASMLEDQALMKLRAIRTERETLQERFKRMSHAMSDATRKRASKMRSELAHTQKERDRSNERYEQLRVSLEKARASLASLAVKLPELQRTPPLGAVDTRPVDELPAAMSLLHAALVSKQTRKAPSMHSATLTGEKASASKVEEKGGAPAVRDAPAAKTATLKAAGADGVARSGLATVHASAPTGVPSAAEGDDLLNAFLSAPPAAPPPSTAPPSTAQQFLAAAPAAAGVDTASSALSTAPDAQKETTFDDLDAMLSRMLDGD